MESNHGYTDASFRADLKRSIDAAWMRDKIIKAVPATADQVHVQQILLYNANDAQSVLQKLKGGADFNTLAAQYDPDARGDLGWFPKAICSIQMWSKRHSACKSGRLAM